MDDQPQANLDEGLVNAYRRIGGGVVRLGSKEGYRLVDVDMRSCRERAVTDSELAAVGSVGESCRARPWAGACHTACLRLTLEMEASLSEDIGHNAVV